MRPDSMTNVMRNMVEDIVRDEVERFWEKRGRTWRKSIENIMVKTRGGRASYKQAQSRFKNGGYLRSKPLTLQTKTHYYW